MLARFIKTLTPLPTHPLYLFTLSLALGIAWQATTLPLFFPILIGLVIFILFSPRLRQQQYLALLLAAAAIFFLGALRYQQRVDNFNTFHRLIGRRPVQLVARVIDCEPSYRQEGTFIATLAMEKIQSSDPKFILSRVEGTSPGLRQGFGGLASGRADSKISGHRFFTNISGPPPFEVGDTVTLERVFFRPPADGGEYWRYLIKEGLVAHVRARPESFTVVEHPPRSFYRSVSALRNRILESAKKELAPQTFALFTSIFWGKHAVDQRQLDTIREEFRPWGILHYLARAGLHLTMLIMLLQKAVTFLPLPFMVRTVLGAGLIGAYALLSWSSISFIRAVLVFFLFVLCTLLWTPSHGLYRLTLACFLILLSNPLQLFFLDFQLSFLVTFVFMWLPALTKAQNS